MEKSALRRCSSIMYVCTVRSASGSAPEGPGAGGEPPPPPGSFQLGFCCTSRIISWCDRSDVMVSEVRTGGGGGRTCELFSRVHRLGSGGPADTVVSGIARRALTASKWSRLCNKLPTCSSNRTFSVRSWCKHDSKDAMSKCWACSMRNCEPCSHCLSSSWSRLCAPDELPRPELLLEFGAALLMSGGGTSGSTPAEPAACAASSALNCSCRRAAAPLSGFNSLPSICGAVQLTPILFDSILGFNGRSELGELGGESLIVS